MNAPLTFSLFAMLLAVVTPARAAGAAGVKEPPIVRVTRTDAEWKALLSPGPFGSYAVLRHAATEPAFTGRYWNEHRKGLYRCAGCGLELFRSDSKYDSGTGWPSFWRPVANSHVEEHAETPQSQGYPEVRCARCGGHLGHVFPDGPRPTGLRYCMNSASLDFTPAK